MRISIALAIVLWMSVTVFADVELHQPKITVNNLSLFTNSYINNITFSTGTVLPGGLSPTGCQWGIRVSPPFLTAFLIACASIGDILMEDGSFILEESGDNIAVE